MSTTVAAVLTPDVHQEFLVRINGFPGGRTGLIKDALRFYFENHPMSDEQKNLLEELKAKKNADAN